MSSNDRRYFRRQALVSFLTELREAEKRGSESLIWQRTRTVLDWLYQCEEAERTLDTSYYAGRDADPRGKALAGLIWVRGLAVHHQAELRIHIFRDASQRTQLQMNESGISIAEAFKAILSPVWPPRAALPAGKPEKKGRDLAYDGQVANRPLTAPLAEAVSYLMSLP